MENTDKKISDEELRENVKDAAASSTPKGPGKTGCRMIDDPLHCRWKIAVTDAPVIAE